MLLEVDFKAFNKMVEEGITLIDFGAPWCPPCRMQDPILQILSEELAAKIKVAKVDVDKEPELSAQFGIQGLPTLLLFKDGELISSFRGFQREEDLRRNLQNALD